MLGEIPDALRILVKVVIADADLQVLALLLELAQHRFAFAVLDDALFLFDGDLAFDAQWVSLAGEVTLLGVTHQALDGILIIEEPQALLHPHRVERSDQGLGGRDHAGNVLGQRGLEGDHALLREVRDRAPLTKLHREVAGGLIVQPLHIT